MPCGSLLGWTGGWAAVSALHAPPAALSSVAPSPAPRCIVIASQHCCQHDGQPHSDQHHRPGRPARKAGGDLLVGGAWCARVPLPAVQTLLFLEKKPSPTACRDYVDRLKRRNIDALAFEWDDIADEKAMIDAVKVCRHHGRHGGRAALCGWGQPRCGTPGTPTRLLKDPSCRAARSRRWCWIHTRSGALRPRAGGSSMLRDALPACMPGTACSMHPPPPCLPQLLRQQ